MPNQNHLPNLSKLVQYDVGKRGISNMFDPSQLINSTQALASFDFPRSHFVLISGFYIPSLQVAETDGPPGLFTLANCLLKLGSKLTILTPKSCLPIISAALSPLTTTFPNLLSLLSVDNVIPELSFDAVITIEAVGAAEDGKCYTMRGFDCSNFACPSLDSVLTRAQDLAVPSVCIGDGGNELGMGNFKEIVHSNVPLGSVICSRSLCSLPFVVGVSNWGCFALVIALSLELNNSSVMPSVEEEHDCLIRIVEAGAKDGVSGEGKESVDGFDWGFHKNLYEEMLALVQE
ncbi:hypothetical protein GEMRC1_012238 [Eukaryota sp. GEM-RC1]